jgi:ABC-2 type transport system permease protein
MRNHLRSLRWAAWLGWQIESNWTQPWLFLVYVLVKPLTGSLLLVCMFTAVRLAPGNSVSPEFLPFLFVGNACYLLVGAVTFSMSYAVFSDREQYRMLKYIYISPARLISYLIGRGLARAVEAVLGGLLTLGIGMLLFPELRTALTRQPLAWNWLAVYLLLGTAMLVALGVILSAAVLNTTRQAMFLSEGIAGVLYLLSGTVFPLGKLPTWLQPLSLALPTTYWLEGMRRTLLGWSDAEQLPSPLGRWDHQPLALWLAVSTVVLSAAAIGFFRWSERRAWRLGRLDETSGW